LGKEDSIISYKGMENFVSDKGFTGSNTSKFIRHNSKNSNNTNTNSAKSTVKMNVIKKNRKLALQKKSTLLFIQENPNDNGGKNNVFGFHHRPPINEISKLTKKKTMISEYRGGSLITRSKSFVNRNNESSQDNKGRYRDLIFRSN
jgi:hypothetical protein